MYVPTTSKTFVLSAPDATRTTSLRHAALRKAKLWDCLMDEFGAADRRHEPSLGTYLAAAGHSRDWTKVRCAGDEDRHVRALQVAGELEGEL